MLGAFRSHDIELLTEFVYCFFFPGDNKNEKMTTANGKLLHKVLGAH